MWGNFFQIKATSPDSRVKPYRPDPRKSSRDETHLRERRWRDQVDDRVEETEERRGICELK